MTFSHLLGSTPRSPIVRYGAAVASVVFATLLRLLLDPWLGDSVPYITFFAAVTIAGWIGGGGPAGLAVVLSATTATYLFVPQYYSFVITDLGHAVGLLVFIVMGGVIALTCGVMKQAQERSARQAVLLQEQEQRLHAQLAELKKHEEESAERLARVTEVLNSIAECYVAFDADFRFRDVNPQAAVFLGRDRGDLVGRRVWDVFPELKGTPLGETLRDALERQSPVAREVPSIRQPGHYVEFHLHPRAGGLDVYWRDITERKRAEEALRQGEERLHGIVQSAMDAIITIDAEQRVVLFNGAAERMFGCSAVDAVGHPIIRFIPERHREAHEAHVRGFAETGVTARRMGSLGALSGLRRNGEEFPIEASISQMVSGSVRLFTVILRDITERQRTEQALRESEERLREALRQVEQSKQELQERVTELELFHDVVVGRELRMIELEREIARLKGERVKRQS